MNKTERTKENISKLYIIIAMVSFGTIGLFVKNINLPSAEIALWRGVLAIIILFALLLVSKKSKSLFTIGKDIWKFVLSGIAMGFNWVFLFEAYNHTSVALSTLSYYFAPTLIMIASIFIFKEKLSSKQILCFIASTVGLLMIIGVSGGSSSDIIGVLYGIGAAFLYATIILINKANGTIEGLVRTFIQFASAVIVLFPYISFKNGFQIHKLDSSGLVSLLILGIFHTGLMYYLYFKGLSNVSGQQAAILSYIDPAVAVVLSVIILDESISGFQLLGGIIILLATLINEI